MASSDEKLIAALNLDLTVFNKLLEQGITAAKILKTNLKDLSGIRVGHELEDWGRIQEKNNQGLKSGKEHLREFYREQRIQDRTTREASQAVIGFTVGLAALFSTSGKVEGATKNLTQSLLAGVTAAQGMEFSTAAVGIAGRNLPGIFGKISNSLIANAGTIGAVVGVGAGLISFFMNVNEEAKKAAEEGLSDFEKKLKDMPIGQQGKVQGFLESRLTQSKKDLEKAQKDILSIPEFLPGKENTYRESNPAYTQQIQLIQAKKDDIALTEKYLDKAKEISEEARLQKDYEEYTKNVIIQTGTRIQKIDARLAEINKKKAQGVAVDENGKKLADEEQKLQKERKELTQSTDDAQNELVKRAKESYSTGKLTTDEYIKQLETARAILIDAEKKAAVDREILAVKKQQAEQEIAIALAVKSAQINFKKEIETIRLQGEENYLKAAAKTEYQKLAIARTIALERINIENDAEQKILDAKIKAVNQQLNVPGLTDKEKSDLLAQRQGLFTEKYQAATKTNDSKKIPDAQFNQGVENLSQSIDAKLAGNQEEEHGNVTKLATTQQLNAALIGEENRLVNIEKQLLNEKDIARKEELDRERDATNQKIALIQTEIAAREEATAQMIQSGFAAYDASQSIAANMGNIARQSIRQALSVAVADSLKSVFATVPFPFSIIVAETAGAAVAAVFESLVPKFAQGEVNIDRKGVVRGPGGPTEDAIPAMISAGESITSARRTSEYPKTLQRIHDGTLPKIFETAKYAAGKVSIGKYIFDRRDLIPEVVQMAQRDLVRTSTTTAAAKSEAQRIDVGGIESRLDQLSKDIGSLNSAIENMPPPTVKIVNPITLQEGLRTEIPEYEKFKVKKNVD